VKCDLLERFQLDLPHLRDKAIAAAADIAELEMVARLQLEDQISAMKRLPISTINASVESTQADWRAEQQLKEETEAMNARDKANDPKAINAAHGLLMAATDALSADNVAAMLKITKKAATLQLKELQGLGLLESEPRKGGVSHYRLIAAPASNTTMAGDVEGKTDAAIDGTAPEMQYLAPEDYELPPADPALLALANRMQHDRLEGVAHALRGCGLPALADITGHEDLQMATAALAGAYQMSLAELASQAAVITELRARVEAQILANVESANSAGRLLTEVHDVLANGWPAAYEAPTGRTTLQLAQDMTKDFSDLFEAHLEIKSPAPDLYLVTRNDTAVTTRHKNQQAAQRKAQAAIRAGARNAEIIAGTRIARAFRGAEIKPV